MKIPQEVKKIIKELKDKGFKAFAVGGCVRDFLLEKEPNDWDVTTDATPDQIQKVFPESLYENKFGTVVVSTGSQVPSLKEVEITTYRIDETYSDKRHPDAVRFSKSLKDDLARRDFTVNAIAWDGKEIIDPFGGQDDLKKRLIRAVGEPKKRFSEDALRLMRAVRFAVQLDFEIEELTAKALKEQSGSLVFISKERIRDELIKILMTRKAAGGIQMLSDFGLLKHITPELEAGIGVGQNKHHIYNIWDHNLKSLDWAASKDWNLDVRIAALFHDIAKPQTKQGNGPDSTFYNHEVVGAKVTAQILERLHFPRKTIDKIVLLVRWHLFYYNVGEVTERSVRRLIRQVGIENMDDLLQLRFADRKGSGVPKEEPYKLRHLKFVIEKVSRDALSVKMLKVDGNDIMKLAKIEPGPKIGQILNILLDKVIDNPDQNQKEILEKQVLELSKLSKEKLAELAGISQEKMLAIEEAKEEQIKKKYFVK